MAASSKLPVPIQLVGVTAVLVFCTAVVSAIGYGQAIARDWQILSQMPRTWDGFYSLVVTSVGFYSALAIVSATIFALLLFGRTTIHVRASLAYLALLLVALAWRIYWHFPAGGMDGLRMLAPMGKLYFAVRIFYAVWLVGLAWAVLPKERLNKSLLHARPS